MISVRELKTIVSARLKDAEILYQSGRFDGAFYLCGYAVEIALKIRVCKTLKWNGFPATKSEFQNLQSFKTHSLDLLLKLSGVEEKVKINNFADWSRVVEWDSEKRYSVIGTITQTKTFDMIESAKVIVKALR